MTDLTTAEPIPDTCPPAPPSPWAAGTRRSGERGQGIVEYAFILILIAIAVLIAIEALGHATNTLYTNISSGVSTASGH